MNDLISRQAAIETVVAEGRTVDSRYLESERIIHESDAVEALSMLPSVRSEPRWISVEEQLPTPNTFIGNVQKYYLIQNEYGDMMVAAYQKNNSGYTWWEQMYTHEPIEDGVIAWMSLPKPYERSE